MDGHRPQMHWDDEIIGFDVHPTEVVGVGSVRMTEGLDQQGNAVKFIEAWDGADLLDAPAASAGVKPVNTLRSSHLPLARWTLKFTETSVHLTARALPTPAPWGDED